MILCMITIFYAGRSFYNYHRRCSFFTQHLNPRSKMTTSMFFRFLTFCLFVALLAAFVDIFDMASLIGESGLLPFSSWSAVHKDDLILVISKGDKSRSASAVRIRTEVIWWMAPMAAFALVAVFASTKECWVAGEHFCIATKKRTVGLFVPKQKFDLPIQYVCLFHFRSLLLSPLPPSPFFRFHEPRTDSCCVLGWNRQLEGVTVVPLTIPPKAVHDPFKSGWDDTIKSAESLKKQTSFKPKAKISPLRIPPPILKFPSPTNSNSSSVEEDGDASFAASTQDYLLSPTGKQALGRAGMNIFSPKSQSAVDLDVHAESQQLIRKSPVSKADTVNVDKHFRPPAQGVPSTPDTFTSFVPLPNPARPDTQVSSSPIPRLQPPVDRAPRPRDSLRTLSAWPQPPTCIPLSDSPSPSRCTLSPSPTTTLNDGGRDSYYDYVRQPSPTYSKMSITNRDRAYIFGTPTAPTFTPPPPPQSSPPSQGKQGVTQVGAAVELKEAHPSRTPVLVEATDVSPSVSSFVSGPSVYSTHSGN